ncbi:MAG TPA: serine/threonine-protein kinase, partial [Polyangiales bacterium]|nr:serine/threonine-protein kinase [Polyangiales bacterium]
EGVIGEGGMGVVVSAWHLGLRQRVAIKLLLADGGQIEQAALERFQREARAAARIRSEHVCRVIDVGMLPAGTPYLVLEYLEGCDLADELARRGRLPAQEAVGYVLEACEALAEAHIAGIIHRDLKPANLFLSRRNNGSRCLKLLDFGVSKSIEEGSLAQFSLTKTSSIVGSPIYMSPEQLNSAKDVDARTDIWALGALTYELIAGRPPFFAETIPQLVSQVLHVEPPSFAELGITAPGGLEQVLRKALTKSRDQRYPTVAAFAEAIGPFAPDDSMSVSRIMQIRPTSGAREPLPETVADRELRRTPRSKNRKRTADVTSVMTERPEAKRKLAWAALVLLLIVGAGVAAALSRRGGVAEDVQASDHVNAAADAGTRAVSAAMLPPSLPTLPEPLAEPAQAPSAEPPAETPPPPVVEPEKPRAGLRTKPKQERAATPTLQDPSPPKISNFGGRR